MTVMSCVTTWSYVSQEALQDRMMRPCASSAPRSEKNNSEEVQPGDSRKDFFDGAQQVITLLATVSPRLRKVSTARGEPYIRPHA